MRKMKLLSESKTLTEAHQVVFVACLVVQRDVSHSVFVVETVAWFGPRR